MSAESLEQRVETLEQEVRELKAALRPLLQERQQRPAAADGWRDRVRHKGHHDGPPDAA